MHIVTSLFRIVYTCHKKGFVILKASVTFELSFDGKRLNCLIYTLSKTDIPWVYFYFKTRVFQNRGVLPENESNFTPRNFNKRDTYLISIFSRRPSLLNKY